MEYIRRPMHCVIFSLACHRRKRQKRARSPFFTDRCAVARKEKTQETEKKTPTKYKRVRRDIRQDTITLARREFENATFANMLPHCPYLRADKLILLCERHFLRLHHRLTQLSENCDC